MQLTYANEIEKLGVIIAVLIGIKLAKKREEIKIIKLFWSTLFLYSSLLKIIELIIESGAKIFPKSEIFASRIKKLE